VIAVCARERSAAPSGLPAIPVPRYPALRQRDAFDREYLLDVAAAATARTPPGSLPACWLLLDNREHIEAICRDYGTLEAENGLVADQLDDAERRAVAAERARELAVADLKRERERHATTQRRLAASMEHAARLQLQNLRLLAELAVTRHMMATLDRRYRALRVAILMAEVADELHAHRAQCGWFTTEGSVDDTQVIDVDEVAATEASHDA